MVAAEEEPDASCSCSWLMAVRSAQEHVGQEATPQTWPLKIPARLQRSQRWPFTGLGALSPAPTWSPWGRYMLTWSEAQGKRISKWKDLFGCLPRLRGKLLVVKVLRLGIGSRWGSTNDSLICRVFLRLSSRSLPSVPSQESRWKSPLLMSKSTFVMNW